MKGKIEGILACLMNTDDSWTLEDFFEEAHAFLLMTQTQEEEAKRSQKKDPAPNYKRVQPKRKAKWQSKISQKENRAPNYKRVQPKRKAKWRVSDIGK